MNRIPRSSPRNSNNQVLKPGIYLATVKSVCSPEGYQEDNAIDVTYEMVNTETSAKTSFKERFFISQSSQINARTEEFCKHLLSLGLENYEDYVGYKLKLEFLFQIKHNRTYLNIVNRTLVSAPGKDDGEVTNADSR